RENRFLVDTIISCEGDRNLDPPRGIHGGEDGLPGRITHLRPDGSTDPVYSKFSGYRVKAGDTLRLETPMGGGYGSPLERDPQQVLADIRDGCLQADEARERYGVAPSADGKSVDEAETAKLRSSQR